MKTLISIVTSCIIIFSSGYTFSQNCKVNQKVNIVGLGDGTSGWLTTTTCTVINCPAPNSCYPILNINGQGIITEICVCQENPPETGCCIYFIDSATFCSSNSTQENCLLLNGTWGGEGTVCIFNEDAELECNDGDGADDDGDGILDGIDNCSNFL